MVKAYGLTMKRGGVIKQDHLIRSIPPYDSLFEYGGWSINLWLPNICRSALMAIKFAVVGEQGAGGFEYIVVMEWSPVLYGLTVQRTFDNP